MKVKVTVADVRELEFDTGDLSSELFEEELREQLSGTGSNQRYDLVDVVYSLDPETDIQVEVV